MTQKYGNRFGRNQTKNYSTQIFIKSLQLYG